MTGYLTYQNKRLRGTRNFVDFYIPNLEIKNCYETVISKWFKEKIGNEEYDSLLESLTSGNIELFKKNFSEFVLNSFSYFDVTEKAPEGAYQMFVLGMLSGLDADYNIKSNREVGYGRADLILIPKDINKLGIIIEFKKFNKNKDENLEKTAEIALSQIEEKKYDQELLFEGINNVLKLAMVFDGKKVLIKTVKNY
jgi:hypothetical protein